jgi:hypothetical protein
MAYTQDPGRSPMLKTGRDLPTAFMQVDPKAKNNPKTGEHIGYNPKTSELPNTENKGGYEKSLDKVGKLLILRGGDKKEISRAQIGTKQEVDLRSKFENMKSYTEGRRADNLNFLESRKTTGETADKNIQPPTKQMVSKKTAYDIKEASNQKLKPSARKHYAENAQASMKNKK